MQEGSQVEGLGLSKTGQAARIREVWKQNLDTEMHMLRQLIQKYPYVAMDAEFPGIVARPIGNFAGSKAEYHYQTLRCNVDILKPIQIGITLYSADGQLPPQQDQSLSQQTGKFQGYNHPIANQNIPCTWVFNFSFNLEEDMYADSSISLLQSAGVNFALHATQGIDHEAFGALLTTSGLCFNEDVNWLSFHSGYDFGYLIKLLSNDALPMEKEDFFDLVKIYFPKLWDIKFLLRHAQKLRTRNVLSQSGIEIVDHLGSKSGLNDLADELGCVRVGKQSQKAWSLCDV
jgi:CCR4-NOT transcription complex subunit 7/8